MVISRNDYKTIIQSQLDGKLTILIDTSIWRQLFDKMDLKKLSALVNRPVGGKIILIRLLSRIDLPLLLLCIGTSISAFGWWTAAIGPILVISVFYYGSIACMGRQSLGAVSIFLTLAFITSVLQSSWDLSTRAFILFVAITFFLKRFLYVFTSRFVFSLINSSYEFFSKYYLQPAEYIGEVMIPLIWTDPEYKNSEKK